MFPTWLPPTHSYFRSKNKIISSKRTYLSRCVIEDSELINTITVHSRFHFFVQPCPWQGDCDCLLHARTTQAWVPATKQVLLFWECPHINHRMANKISLFKTLLEMRQRGNITIQFIWANIKNSHLRTFVLKLLRHKTLSCYLLFSLTNMFPIQCIKLIPQFNSLWQ